MSSASKASNETPASNNKVGRKRKAEGGSNYRLIITDAEDSDVETAYERDARATVHWNPDCAKEGKLIGYRINVLSNSSKGTFKKGRIVGFDAQTNMHKIAYNERGVTTEWIWIEEETVQLFGEFVWAKVKGFSWWPAQTLVRDDADDSFERLNHKDSWIRVSFFGQSGVINNIKRSSATIKPLSFKDVKNESVKKHVKTAFDEAVAEWKRTADARNVAAEDFAKKSFHIANKVGQGYLGRRVEVFRDDINYPIGVTLTGVIRQFSPSLKKWLIAYDDDKRDASWMSLSPQVEFLDKSKIADVPTPSDVAPFLFGNAVDNYEYANHCMGCIKEVSGSAILECVTCHKKYHPSCLDPPMSKKQALETSGWKCDKCTECHGCNRLDKVFGSIEFPAPKSLSTIDPILCSDCIPKYDEEKYCPNCGHVWDEVRYKKTQNSIDCLRNSRVGALKRFKAIEPSPNVCLKVDDDMSSSSKTFASGASGTITSASGTSLTSSINPFAKEAYVDSSKVDPSLFRPDSSCWGYNESAMLACDACNLWVHAGCANLTEEEYELTTSGDHPIYAKEFLCRACCKRRSELLVKSLQNEDTMGLFAMPVTEEMAPTYRDVVKNPMDLHTMMRHVTEGVYFNYVWVRESFELMVHNALIFNRPNSKFWNEAKRFYNICMLRVFAKLAKATPPVVNSDAVQKSFELGQRQLDQEQARIQQDKSAKKKDMIGGEAVEVVDVQKALASPIDPPSCVPCADLRLTPVDAHYCSWMEACFTCGSSGAADTMLFCIDCGEAYHSFCVNAPVMSMNDTALASWRCPNCKICEITGGVPADETKLLYCEMCDRGFTLDLVDPPLRSVPPGLWICGHCVDCKQCGNTSEKRISLKHWSRDPQLCYRCGGCKGIAAVDSLLKERCCPICFKYYRKNDAGLLRCKSCKLSVHIKCDPSTGNVTSDPEKWKMFCLRYECALCRAKTGNAGFLALDNVHLDDTVHVPAVSLSSLRSDPKALIEEMKPILEEEVDWQVKALWTSEYQAIAVDGVRMFVDAKAKLGPGWESTVLTKDPRIPAWVLYRSARWMRFVKNSIRAHEKSSDVPPRFDAAHVRQFFTSFSHISSLVNDAKNAASFIYLACIHLRLDVKTQCKFRDRLRSLVVPTDPNGLSQLPCDSLNIITPYLTQLRQESQTSREESAADALLRLVMADNAATPEASDESTVVETAPPTDNISSQPVVQEKHSLPAEIATGKPTDPKADIPSANAEPVVSKPQVAIVPAPIKVTKPVIETPKPLLATPLIGWNMDHGVPKEKKWKDPRSCCLCHISGDDDAGLPPSTYASSNVPGEESTSSGCSPGAGRLLPLPGGMWIHATCAIWSSEVWDAGRGQLKAVEKAKSRSQKLKCFGCGRNGASIGCQKQACSCNYHFLCAVACGAVFTDQQHVFCRNHISSAKGIIPVSGASFEQMRTLKVVFDSDEVDTLSCPCFRIGTLVVHSLGSIEQDSKNFHSNNYITPNGFVATRIFWSGCAPRKRTLYILRIDKSSTGLPVFSITPADNQFSSFKGRTVDDAYAKMMKCVIAVNRSTFSQNDLYSHLPMCRVMKSKTDFLLNGPQFFGFGLSTIRRAIELLPGSVATALPLTPNSPKYSFCFHLPKKDDVRELQRRRAAKDAESALQNASGCARTEGLKAVTKSGGSGRVTRALVRNVDDDQGGGSGGRNAIGDKNEAESNTHQAKYKELKSFALSERLVAKRSHIHGWGLFTKVIIPKHGMVVEYMGETVRQLIADKRERAYEMSGIGSCYMFRLDMQRIVDATMIGCMARFMNHCCQPNAYAKVINVDNGFGIEKKIVVFAKRDIPAGEEITYDYKFPVEDGSLQCTCGAPNCIGRMN